MTQFALLFPGQGSQSVGMLAELAANHPLIEKTYAEASDVLGYDLWQLTQQGPADLLNQTERTQPALLAAGVALYRVWRNNRGERPSFVAGHSLGEYTALVCAGSILYQDAIQLVALRGRLMQQAVREGEGAMAAIVGLDDEKIQQICLAAAEGQVLAPANFNAIGQTVVAGETAAVARAVDLAKAGGAKLAKQIPVSVPSHCSLMAPAAEQLAQPLQHIEINRPQFPVVTNVDVVCYDAPDQIRSALVRQLVNPVRWVETIQYLAQQGMQHFMECGPGKVLAGLNKRIVPDVPMVSLGSIEGLKQGLDVAMVPIS